MSAMINPTPIPSTLDYLLKHAETRPHEMAVIDHGQKIPFGLFLLDVCKMRRAIQSYNIKQGAFVAVNSAQFYVHWVVQLACESLEIPTFSFATEEAAALKILLSDAGLVLCCPAFQDTDFKYDALMDEDWLKSIRNMEPEVSFSTLYSSEKTGLRLIKSSGTTGQFKIMLHTALGHELRVRHCQDYGVYSERSCLLLSQEFTVQSMHNHATAVLRKGGCCIRERSTDYPGMIEKHGITHVHILPYVLRQILDVNAENPIAEAGLTVVTGGAAVDPTLRADTERLFKARIVCSYGANEVGFICSMQEDGVGKLMNGVTVEVLNNEGRAVFGEEGVVRIKTPGRVDGYLNDEDASARMFEGEWFYPGDVAVMIDESSLRLVGRTDELINIAGTKFLPQPFENRICKDLAVQDCCLKVVKTKQGEDVLNVILVKEEQVEKEPLIEQIRPILPRGIKYLKFLFVSEIPRTTTGKVQRFKLEN